MKEQIKKEVMRVFNQEANVDDVVNNIISIIESYKHKSLAEQIELCECGLPKSFVGGLCKDPNCKGKINFKFTEQ